MVSTSWLISFSLSVILLTVDLESEAAFFADSIRTCTSSEITKAMIICHVMTPYITIKWSTHLFSSLWCHRGLLRAPLPVILLFPFAFWHPLCGCLLNLTKLSNYKDLFSNFTTVCLLDSACTVSWRRMLDKKLVRLSLTICSHCLLPGAVLSLDITVRENEHIFCSFPQTKTWHAWHPVSGSNRGCCLSAGSH